MKLIDKEYALRTFIDNEIRLETVYPDGDWDGTFEHGVNCGLENACKLLDECPTVNPLQELQHKLETKSLRTYSHDYAYGWKDAMQITLDAIEEVMKKYEIS